MKITIRTLLWALIACLGLWQALVFAQSTDNKQNLLACKKGWEACDRSTLTQSGSAEVAVAGGLFVDRFKEFEISNDAAGR